MARRHWNIDYHGGDLADRIAEGDVIQWGKRGQKLGKVTLIRPVNSKQWPDRWRVEFEPVETIEIDVTLGQRLRVLGEAYGPHEGPQDYPCGLEECEGCNHG